MPVKAGQRDVVITFLNRTSALDETARLPFQRPYPAGVNIPETRLGAYLRSVEIVGPLDATGPGAVRESPSYLHLCAPTDEAVRAQDPVVARAPRVPSSGDRRRCRSPARVLS